MCLYVDYFQHTPLGSERGPGDVCLALDVFDYFRLSCHLCAVRLLSRLFVQCRGLRLSCFHPSVVATNALPQLSRGARPQLSHGHASRMRSCLLRASSLLSCTGLKTKIFIKVQGDVSEPNHLRCDKELTAPTDPRQCARGVS